jgi:serpin B
MNQALGAANRLKRYQAAVDAINPFTADLYGHVGSTTDSNVFVSPYSVHAALTMSFAGAAGETASQMAKVLRLSPDLPFFSTANLVVDEIFGRESAVGQLVVANALWAQAGLRLQPRFAQESAGFLHQVDFVGSCEKARQTINSWVADRTADRIRELLGPGSLNDLTRLILTNAIYFKADWREKFEPSLTADRPFYLANGATVSVPTMCQTADFRAYEDERFTAINLLYEGFHLSMQVFVPRQEAHLPSLAKTVLATNPDQWQRKMEWRRVDLTLPRFRFETSVTIGATLASMGMAQAFDREAADFSGITPDTFWLSDVIHKTYVDVNEEGTEAAGATAAILCGGVGADYEPLLLKVDRPFVFTICGHPLAGGSATLLFVGQVADPRE